MDWTGKEEITGKLGTLIIVPKDERCSSLTVTFQREGRTFEQTLHLQDFVNLKALLKQGQTLQKLNSHSLLFAKLMLANAHRDHSLQIIELSDLPWRKVLRGQAMSKLKIKTEEHPITGVALKLREDLMVILPLLLEMPVNKHPSAAPHSLHIRNLFFEGRANLH